MCDRDPHFRHVSVEKFLGAGEILDARTDVEGLATAITLAQQRLAHDQRIERRYEGSHGETIHRRRGDDGKVTHTGQSELQGAWNRRRGEREHMHLGTQMLEPLLVGDAEMLLLVDDQKSEILELDGLAEQGVGADHDVDAAVADTLLHLRKLLAGNQARCLADMHGNASEAIGEGLGMLARKQGGRHDHCDLLAVHDRHESGTERHLGLAEPNVTAYQPIHRPAGGEITQHAVDGGLLVLGLLVRKSGAEFVVQAVTDGEMGGLTQLPLSGNLDQFVRDLANAALHARLARLPGTAAEPIKVDVGLLRAIARKQLDVLHRQEQLVAAGIVDLEAVVGGAGSFDRAQPDKAPDAVIDVHDQIAGAEARDLGDEVFRAACNTSRPHQPVAQDVLLADHRDVGGLEPAFEAEHRERDLRAGQRQRLLP